MTNIDVQPPGEDGFAKEESNLYARAQAAATGNAPHETPAAEPAIDFLKLVGEAEAQGGRFMLDQIKNSWDRSYKAFHNRHFEGSKYKSNEYKGRSKIFRPKTRSAVRKANASAASALFSTRDAVSCTPGNEGDPRQRASAKLIQELLNYRTDRTSGRAAIPWFRTVVGAHQDTLIMSACLSKQYWKLELKSETIKEPVTQADGKPVLNEDGTPMMRDIEVFKPSVDRPDVSLVPLENVIIDTAANWLDPVQSATYFIVKYPMRPDEIRQKQKHPLNPWNDVDIATLRGAGSDSKLTSSGTRAAREGGLDRMDNTATGSGEFEVIWVYECFFRVGGQDVCFYSAGDKKFLTDPKPVEEVYPEQGGERPYSLGVSSLESHRIFPMAPVEAWQPLQQEINDLANLRLDQVKQNVSPITFVKRGRQVDLAALQRRGPNTTILRTDKDDVEFDRPPEVPSSAYAEMERLNVDFDDQAGQFNSGSVQTNRSLNETVGGLNLISASANSVQEFDLRTWVETWVEPVLGQLVRLIQFYESDETILGLCGDRAELLQTFGIDQITDDLLEQQIAVRVDVGLGASNPQTKLQNLAAGLNVLGPVWEKSPQVQSGEVTIDIEELTNEVMSLAGYRDGGKRFVKKGQPRGPDPAKQGMLEKLMSEVAKNKANANLTNAKASEVGARLQMDAADLIHGQKMDRTKLVTEARTHRENMDRTIDNDKFSRESAEKDRQLQSQPPAEAQDAPTQDDGNGEMLQQLVQLLQQKSQGRQFEFIRDPATGRISGARELPAQQGAA